MKQNVLKSTLVLLMFFCSLALSAQQIITGTVTEAASGLPIPGTNVVIKGTNTGTTADFDGKFTLEVPELPVTLVFSSLGFAKKEISIATA